MSVTHMSVNKDSSMSDLLCSLTLGCESPEVVCSKKGGGGAEGLPLIRCYMLGWGPRGSIIGLAGCHLWSAQPFLRPDMDVSQLASCQHNAVCLKAGCLAIHNTSRSAMSI